jgi:hypothetical protein
MATGDATDMAGRMLATLPGGWFPDVAPVLGALLAGPAEAQAFVYDLLQTARAQERIATASGSFLDAISADFFDTALPRLLNETDAQFRTRISGELLREKGTRAGLIRALTDLTGRAPIVFEPQNIADSGAWDTGTLYFDALGGWTDPSLAFQVFVTAYRPASGGAVGISGWDGVGAYWDAGSAFYWIDDNMVSGQVTDAAIYARVASVIPAGTVAWVAIFN